jgi:hypothetical protein
VDHLGLDLPHSLIRAVLILEIYTPYIGGESGYERVLSLVDSIFHGCTGFSWFYLDWFLVGLSLVLFLVTHLVVTGCVP